MVRSTSLILLLHVAAGASPVFAAEEQTQYRISLSVSKALSQTVDATFAVSQRYQRGADQTLLRVSLDKDLSENLSIGGGVAYSQSAGVTEIRPHQQLGLRFGAVSLRTRLEQRLFDNQSRTEVRLRQRIQATMSVIDGTQAVVGSELIYVLRSRNEGDSARISSVRAFLEIRHRISSHAEMRIGYMYSRSLRAGMPDQVSHSPQLSMALSY